ncbi:MAG: M56 family metallopeptidase [Gemmatimonadaceae bacterium]
MLTQVFNQSTVQSVLPTLVDAALKGAVLVAIAALATYVLRDRSAASRHAIWTAAIVGHLTIPILALLMPAWTVPVVPAAPWMTPPVASTAPRTTAGASQDKTSPISQTDNATGSSPVTQAKPLARATTPTTTEGSGKPRAFRLMSAAGGVANFARSASLVSILATIWFLGALFVLLRLAIGTWRVGQLARDGARVEDGVWLSLTQRLANRLGVTRPLTLLRGERLAVPVTWGIVYPAVLLPQDADTWSEERRRFVLVHEMAHVKRFDALTQLLAQISIALFWFDPLVWVAAHRIRVEREHACDDYVLRDGTTPSLYAGELLEMVRSIGTPSHDRAAPAFAALAMARRSEFEGRMLSILDPRIDRHTLNRRSTLMTAVIVALLTFPLAALRPFERQPAAIKDEFPDSFKVSISEPPPVSQQSLGGIMGGDTALRPLAGAALASGAAANASVSQPSSTVKQTMPSVVTLQSPWSCETSYWASRKGEQISVHTDSNTQLVQYVSSTPGRCAEAAVVGVIKFSDDETRIAQLAPGGFARFRERTSAGDHAVSVTPLGDGSLSYSAIIDGKSVPFQGEIQAWLAQFLPQFLREAGLNVPERVARIRSKSGVSGVLREIRAIHSSSAKRAHYEELLKGPLTASEAEMVTTQAAMDLTGSSSDLSAVLQQLPRSSMRSPQTRQAVAMALSRIQSSGDRANTLEILAPNADPEMLLMLASAAEALPSSGDKANFLTTTASEYLSPGSESLRNAFFKTTSTLQSSGDMANVLISAMPYGHASPPIALQIVETSKNLVSSGDAANVLISLISQRVVQPNNARGIQAVIERTLTMASSGDRANVLVSLASNGMLATQQLRDAYTSAAMALPSEGDRANALAAAARR